MNAWLSRKSHFSMLQQLFASLDERQLSFSHVLLFSLMTKSTDCHLKVCYSKWTWLHTFPTAECTMCLHYFCYYSKNVTSKFNSRSFCSFLMYYNATSQPRPNCEAKCTLFPHYDDRTIHKLTHRTVLYIHCQQNYWH